MEIIKRKDTFLNEAIAAIDQIYVQAQHDEAIAFALLGKDELEFIGGEIARCESNYRYYLENYHVIRTEDQQLRTPYPLYDAQEIFLSMVDEMIAAGIPVRIIILKARQLGISTVVQALIWQRTIFKELTNTAVVAQDGDQAAYVVDMSRLAYDNLPWWMRPERSYDVKDKHIKFDRKDAKERMIKPGLRSTIFIEAANKMTGVLVGKQLHNLHATELSLWPDPTILSKQIWPSLNAPDQISVMESTARGRAHFWFKLWKSAMDGDLDWRPCFIEFFRVRKYSLPIAKGETFDLTQEEVGLKQKVLADVNVELTDEQLNWRRMKIKASISVEGDEWGFYQEYPSNWMEAFQSTGLCAFNKKKLHEINNTTCRRPEWYGEITLKIDEKTGQILNVPTFSGTLRKVRAGSDIPVQQLYGGRMRLWEWPRAGETYYIGGDVAQGIKGGDSSCAQVIRIGKGPRPDVQVAEWHGWISPTQYGVVLAALGYFYNSAEIACEANDIGRLTNNELFRVLQYPNLFRWTHDDKIENFMSDFFGWYTNSKTRPMMIAKYREAIDEGTIVIRSEELVDQMFDFSSLDGGRFEGQETHDDRVMAQLICRYCAHNLDWANPPEPARTRPENEGAGKDFHNTDYSPMHDYPQGLRQQAYESGEPNAERKLYDELESGTPDHDGEVDWRNL